LGKDPGADLQQGLITLPILIFLEMPQDTRPVQCVLSGKRDAEHVSAAVQAVLDSGAMELASEEARAHLARGRAALRLLPDNTWQRILNDLLAFVVQRRS